MSYEPMVAFVCGRGAMHTDATSGWVSDPMTDCAEGKDAILKYCQKMYPLLGINNFVESEYEDIVGWCKYGDEKCSETIGYKVQPYR